MTNLKMHRLNKGDDNITKIGKLFPNCIIESKNKNREVEFDIDIDMLREELLSKIEESVIDGKKVFNVEDNYLITCLDDNIIDTTVTAIAKQKPYYFIMQDSSLATNSVATNFEQIFATYSAETIRKVL